MHGERIKTLPSSVVKRPLFMAQDTSTIFEMASSPATIGVAVRIGGQWFVDQDCGSNYYLGHGPGGILALRKACFEKKAIMIASERDMEVWLKEWFGPPKGSKAVQARKQESIQFEKLVSSIQSFCVGLSRRCRTEGFSLKEEQLRDQLLPMLDGIFRGRSNGEAYSGSGKTDILVRTKNGRNEHIFELKVWKGVKSLIDAVQQLSTYVTWHNDHAGILMLVREHGFSAILRKAEERLKKDPRVTSLHEHGETSFRFKLKYPTDPDKVIVIHLELVPMS